MSPSPNSLSFRGCRFKSGTPSFPYLYKSLEKGLKTGLFAKGSYDTELQLKSLKKILIA